MENTEADALKEEVQKRLEGLRNLSWRPVIQIAQPTIWRGGEFENACFGFTLARYWIAVKGNGYWLRAPWDQVTDADRLSHSFNLGLGKVAAEDLRFPYIVGHAQSKWTLLEYSEEVWLGLERIQAAILAAKERFEAILATPEGIAQIATFGLPQLLPAPSYGTSPAGGVYAKYIKAAIPTSADLMELEEGEVCPDCKRPFRRADVVDFEDYLDSDDYCQTCGMMFYEYEPRPTPPPDPDKAVELSSWDYRALSLIQARGLDLSQDEDGTIRHLYADLGDRGLIVFDAAGVPFLTPKGLNSLIAGNPQKVSNPPLEIALGDGGARVLRPAQPPVQITRRVPSRGLTTPQGETEK